jgi:hypothetical protein
MALSWGVPELVAQQKVMMPGPMGLAGASAGLEITSISLFGSMMLFMAVSQCSEKLQKLVLQYDLFANFVKLCYICPQMDAALISGGGLGVQGSYMFMAIGLVKCVAGLQALYPVGRRGWIVRSLWIIFALLASYNLFFPAEARVVFQYSSSGGQDHVGFLYALLAVFTFTVDKSKAFLSKETAVFVRYGWMAAAFGSVWPYVAPSFGLAVPDFGLLQYLCPVFALVMYAEWEGAQTVKKIKSTVSRSRSAVASTISATRSRSRGSPMGKKKSK